MAFDCRSGLRLHREIQYFSGTNLRPFSVAKSSYAPFIERFAIFTFCLGAFP